MKPHCSPLPTSCTTMPASAMPRGTPSSRAFDEQQLLDVIFTVGNYHVVSFALNSCGVQLDEGVPPAM